MKIKDWFKKEYNKEKKFAERNTRPILSSISIFIFVIFVIYFVVVKTTEDGLIPYTCEITQSNAMLSSNVVNDLNQCFSIPLNIKSKDKQEWCKGRIKSYMKNRYITGGLHSYKYRTKLGTCE